MTGHLPRLLISLLLSLSQLTISAWAQPPTREVEVTVTVRDAVQKPVPGVPILFPDTVDRPAIRTDLAGIAKGKVPVQVGSSTLGVRISPGLVGESEVVRAALREHVEFLERWAFSSKYSIALTAEVENYTLEIVARPAVKVSGRLVDSVGKPVRVTIARTRGLAQPLSGYVKRAPGEFCVGVPKGEKSEIILIATDGRGIVTRQIPASDEAVSLGDIPLPAWDNDSSVKFKWADLPAKYEGQKGGVGFTQLISIDGSRVVQCLVHFPPRGDGLTPDETQAVPSGDYWVVTGWLSADDDEKILAARDATRDGKDLAALGIPRIRLTLHELAEVTVDLAKLRKAVDEVGSSGGR